MHLAILRHLRFLLQKKARRSDYVDSVVGFDCFQLRDVQIGNYLLGVNYHLLQAQRSLAFAYISSSERAQKM